MCDYSLESVNSRKAVKGDKLVTKTFYGRGTTGFTPVGAEATETAVCLLPGTEIAFDAPVKVKTWYEYDQSMGACVAKAHEATTIEHTVARFAKINETEPCKHHDG